MPVGLAVPAIRVPTRTGAWLARRLAGLPGGAFGAAFGAAGLCDPLTGLMAGLLGGAVGTVAVAARCCGALAGAVLPGCAGSARVTHDIAAIAAATGRMSAAAVKQARHALIGIRVERSAIFRITSIRIYRAGGFRSFRRSGIDRVPVVLRSLPATFGGCVRAGGATPAVGTLGSTILACTAGFG